MPSSIVGPQVGGNAKRPQAEVAGSKVEVVEPVPASPESTHPTSGQALYDRIAGIPGRRRTLGISVEGRPIWGMLRAAPPLAPAPARAPHAAHAPRFADRLLLVGGVHGDEPASAEALLEVLAVLPDAASDDGEGAPWAPAVWVIPALNPDGLCRNRKNNANDVDLNRNFPARNFARAHPPGYDPGPVPLSEPESRALAQIIERERQRLAGIVAVHAPFACVNFDGPAAAWAARVSGASGWPVRDDLGYPTPGSLGTWLGVDSGMPILTLELPPGTLTAFRAAAAAALAAALDAAAWVLPG